MSAKFENSWDELLQDEFTKEYYLKLRAFLKDEYQSTIVYPKMDEIFNALKYTPYENVKVVILGQDPYHEENQAHGLAFSVREGVRIPPSLYNIYKELQSDLGIKMPSSGYLEKWARQGVLLLNATLTVRAGQANSHSNIGWQEFTDRIILTLSNREQPIVFLLWGKNARDKKRLINKRHYILEAPHPSPLSASRGFFGCRHFSQANMILKSIGQEEVDWRITI